MPNILITIAIPTYSRLNLLKEAVASALAQSYPHFEVLISLNPGGKDEAAIEQWAFVRAQTDPRIRFQKNPMNLGMAGNWNACADAAKGEFLLLLADDDRIFPDCVEVLAGMATPSVEVVFSNHHMIDEDGTLNAEETAKTLHRYKRDQIPAGLLDHAARWVWQNSVPIVTSLMRSSTLRRLRFREELNTPEIEMFARIAAEGGRFVFCEQYLGEYRYHGGSATAAGLRVDRLLPALYEIHVDDETAPYKQAQIQELARGVLARHLRNHEYVQAQALLRRPEGHAASQAETLNGLRGMAIKAIYFGLQASPRGLLSLLERRNAK